MRATDTAIPTEVPSTKPPARTKLGRIAAGWVGVAVVCIVASLWAYWGGIESFHEGWYLESLWQNIAMMLVQYWLLTIAFIAVGLLGTRFPRVTFGVCVALGAFAAFFFAGAHPSVLWIMIVLPVAALGLLFLFGRPSPAWLARLVVAVPPAAVLLVTSALGVIRVTQRIDDKNYGIRVVEGNGLTLVWAPRGPGWPETYTTHAEATRICARLSEDGTKLLDQDVGIWRLPTVEEAVRSQMLHGESVAGSWDPVARKASYAKSPDKETPLWDPHSPLIYYWTSTMADTDEAYIIVYHGGVFAKRVDRPSPSLSFRAVKDPG